MGVRSGIMNKTALGRVAGSLAALGLAGAAVQAEAATSPYKAPRNGYGQPDLTGAWSNETTTRFERPAEYGGRLVMTPEGAAKVEMSHDARTIRLNAQHDNIPRWFGDSVGHWEGDTLVVDTAHFQPEQLGVNTDQLHLTERFTRVGPDRVLYQFRVEDPGAYSQPWGEYEFHTSKGPQYEYACHEDNCALAYILAGARQQEREGKTAAVTAAAEGE